MNPSSLPNQDSRNSTSSSSRHRYITSDGSIEMRERQSGSGPTSGLLGTGSRSSNSAATGNTNKSSYSIKSSTRSNDTVDPDFGVSNEKAVTILCVAFTLGCLYKCDFAFPPILFLIASLIDRRSHGAYSSLAKSALRSNALVATSILSS